MPVWCADNYNSSLLVSGHFNIHIQPIMTMPPHHMTGVDAVSGARFGQGEGRIWLSGLQCLGSERELSNCPTNSSIAATTCTHALDAGVRCGM